MSSPQGHEVARSPSRLGPDDLGGFNAMVHAKLMYSALIQNRNEPIPTDDMLPAWNGSDRASFSFYRWIDDGLATALPGSNSEAIHREADLLHACLPLSDGERRWMIDTYDARHPESENLDQIIVGSETTITTNGLRQVVRGRELVHRWAAWRREVDEFADQGIIKETRQHLRRISQLLDAPTSSIPAS